MVSSLPFSAPLARAALAVVFLLLPLRAARADAQTPAVPAEPIQSPTDRESAPPVAPNQEVAALRTELADLRARLGAVERAAAAAVPPPSRQRGRAEDEEDRKNSPQLTSHGITLTLSGFVHADFLARIPGAEPDVNPSTGQPTNELRFLIKRARLRIDVRKGILSGGLEFDGNTANGATARIQSAEVALRWAPKELDALPYLMATVGLFKIPFGYEVRLQSDKERLFLERSQIARALFPGEYDLGVKVQGGYKWIRYNVGLMNGAPAGEKQFSLRDPTRSKDFVGRVGFDSPQLGRVSFVIGFSGLYGQGFHAGTTASDGVLGWVDTNGNGMIDGGEIVQRGAHVATPPGTFNRWAVGGDLRLLANLPRVGQLMIYAELVKGTNLDRSLVVADPIAAGRDLDELGYYIAATQELTSWAMVGVRWDEYLPDRGMPTVAGSTATPMPYRFSTFAVTAAARYARYARLAFEYDYNRTALRDPGTGVSNTKVDHLLGVRAELTF